MLAESLVTRGVNFAFLFGPPRTIERQEAAAVYDRVCETLKIQDFTFKYASPETPASGSRGFKIELARKEGKGGFAVTIDNARIQDPIRLLLQYVWPPSLQHVKEQFDLAEQAVFSALEGSWQRAHAEVRLRAQCSVRDRDACGLIRASYLAIPDDWISALGEPLTFLGLKFRTAARAPQDGVLDAPARDLSIEVLQEDSGCLYIELVTTWPQAPAVAGRPAAVELSNLRTFDRKPSDYVEAAHEFLHERVQGLGNVRGGRDE